MYGKVLFTGLALLSRIAVETMNKLDKLAPLIKVFNRKDSTTQDPVPSVNKAPLKYEKYVCKLDQRYKIIAELALHETDDIRAQALSQLREWISKDSRIIRCRTDAKFLLRFLRVKKFNVTEAHEMVYRHLTNRMVFPQWLRNLDVIDPLVEELLDNGAFVPLRQRDAKGRQVIFQDVGALDPDRHTSSDVFRMIEIIYQVYIDDEESQVCGVVYVFEAANVNLKHASMLSITDWNRYSSMTSKASPVRVQEINIVNMPKFGQIFYDVAKTWMPNKLKQRFKVNM